MYYGFNFQWMFGYRKGEALKHADVNELDFIADEGFNFARIPTDYRCFVKNEDCEPDEKSFEYIDDYIEQCNKRGLHANFCIHRAPGYCINQPWLESTNLWRDSETEDKFVSLWKYIAERYKGISSKKLSFDIVNEPADLPPTHPCTREDYCRVMRRIIAEIRTISPEREITIDGWSGGGRALPEMADAGVIHSGRGYEPFRVTHHKAEWANGADKWEVPQYPGEVQKGEYRDIETLRKYYEPWKDVERMGVKIHIGEFGCYNKIQNDMALRWLADLMSVLHENKWGFAMWYFKGSFGIVEHGRPGAKYTQYKGFNVDMDMLNLLKSGMA